MFVLFTFFVTLLLSEEDKAEEERLEFDTFALHVVRNVSDWPLGGVGVDFEIVAHTEYTAESKSLGLTLDPHMGPYYLVASSLEDAEEGGFTVSVVTRLEDVDKVSEPLINSAKPLLNSAKPLLNSAKPLVQVVRRYHADLLRLTMEADLNQAVEKVRGDPIERGEREYAHRMTQSSEGSVDQMYTDIQKK